MHTVPCEAEARVPGGRGVDVMVVKDVDDVGLSLRFVVVELVSVEAIGPE
jgi:hypothetical protein